MSRLFVHKRVWAGVRVFLLLVNELGGSDAAIVMSSDNGSVNSPPTVDEEAIVSAGPVVALFCGRWKNELEVGSRKGLARDAASLAASTFLAASVRACSVTASGSITAWTVNGDSESVWGA
jgi:hypothetical protein